MGTNIHTPGIRAASFILQYNYEPKDRAHEAMTAMA